MGDFTGRWVAGLLWQSLGNLRNRGNAGLFYANARNRLGNERWNIGSRASEERALGHSSTTTPVDYRTRAVRDSASGPAPLGEIDLIPDGLVGASRTLMRSSEDWSH